MLRHAFVAIVLLVCLPLTFAGEGQQVGDAVAFFISKEDHTTKTVKTTVRNGVEVSCSFQFAAKFHSSAAGLAMHRCWRSCRTR